MNDPHVVALVYRIEHSESISYANAAPFCSDEQGFRLSIADAKARFEMHDHFPTIEAADEAHAEFRRAWEFDAQLKHGPDTFRLVLDRETSEIIDRNPTLGHVNLNLSEEISIAESVRHTLSVGEYPSLPSDIALTPDVETMYKRYMGYRKGREPLASMVYFCLTVLENSAEKRNGNRETAAERFKISNNVLSTIGRLSGGQGGSEARKAGGIGKDYSSYERQFLEQAVKTLIRRMAETEHSSSDRLSKVCMSDLPSLKDESDVASKTTK